MNLCLLFVLSVTFFIQQSESLAFKHVVRRSPQFLFNGGSLLENLAGNLAQNLQNVQNAVSQNKFGVQFGANFMNQNGYGNGQNGQGANYFNPANFIPGFMQNGFNQYGGNYQNGNRPGPPNRPPGPPFNNNGPPNRPPGPPNRPPGPPNRPPGPPNRPPGPPNRPPGPPNRPPGPPNRPVGPPFNNNENNNSNNINNNGNGQNNNNNNNGNYDNTGLPGFSTNPPIDKEKNNIAGYFEGNFPIILLNKNDIRR